jgi:hypothetical protein
MRTGRCPDRRNQAALSFDKPPEQALARPKALEPPWRFELQTYALRESLPVLTLALTRHSIYRIGTFRTP